MGSRENTVMLEEFKALLEKSLTNKTDRYWLDQVGLEINDENDLCIVVSSDFIKSAIEKKVYSKIKSVYQLKYNNKADCVFVVDKNFQKTSVYERSSVETTIVEKKQDDIVAETRYDLSFFDELFVGGCNNLAITAAKNVVISPGKRFNPLFVYGKPGVGKTHLLKTIEASSNSSFYIDSESFLESYISGIKNNDIDNFKKRIRSVDILLVDDIQFFVGKKGVSEELFHTINYFLNNSKSVVLASDQKPQELNGFPDRLVSRILNGLVTDIEKPDREIFSEVLKKNNVEFEGLLFSKNDLEMLLSLDFQSFREINGVVNNLIINKQTGVSNNKYISELVSMYSNNKIMELTPEFILKYCSEVYQVDERLVLSKNRSELVSNARHLFIYLMRKHTEYSLNQIGLYVGNRSHSTILSSIKKVEGSSLFKKEVNIFNNKIDNNSTKFVGV
jgi:chromosomal replication initiator protein|tara:strand:- start:230 stop:1570 length:1341 start_codon:yes stop_codon:yes gene_type:complete